MASNPAVAIYVRHDDQGALLAALELLLGDAAGRDVVTGIYADIALDRTPELGVMLGHASDNRFGRLLVADVAHLGASTSAALMTAVCLFDLGVELHQVGEAGRVRMSLDDVGAALGGPSGTALDRIGSRVGLPSGRQWAGRPPV